MTVLCFSYLTGITHKRFLVFINPRSGRKRAVKIYEKRVRPIFDLCGIQTEEFGMYKTRKKFEFDVFSYVTEKRNDFLSKYVHKLCISVTSRANEVRDLLMNIDLVSFDGYGLKR